MKSSLTRQSHTYCKGKRVLLIWLVFMSLLGGVCLFVFGGRRGCHWVGLSHRPVLLSCLLKRFPKLLSILPELFLMSWYLPCLACTILYCPIHKNTKHVILLLSEIISLQIHEVRKPDSTVYLCLDT